MFEMSEIYGAHDYICKILFDDIEALKDLCIFQNALYNSDACELAVRVVNEVAYFTNAPALHPISSI